MTGAQPIKKLLLAAAVLAVPVLADGVLTQRAHLLRDLPPWVVFREMQQTAVIHAAAGEETVTVSLQNGRLTISEDAPLFTSESGWAVADCFLCDLDRDGFDEVMLHVWKRGSFGQHQPFWKKPDDKFRCTEHLFIYEWDTQRPDRLDPLWMSSEMPVRGQEIGIDEQGIIRIQSPDGSETLWQWGSWGLVRVDG